MRNLCYGNDFDLHENETACRTHFYMKGLALRLVWKQAQENLEMAYCFANCNEMLGMDVASCNLELAKMAKIA